MSVVCLLVLFLIVVVFSGVVIRWEVCHIIHGKPPPNYGVSPHQLSHSFTCNEHKRAHPALNQASKAGTWFTFPQGMEGWVDLGNLIMPRPGVEPTTAWSRLLVWHQSWEDSSIAGWGVECDCMMCRLQAVHWWVTHQRRRRHIETRQQTVDIAGHGHHQRSRTCLWLSINRWSD